MTRMIPAVLLIALSVAACGSVKNQKVTDHNKDKILDQIKNSKDLTVEEVGLLQAYIMRKGLGDALAGKTPSLPVGMTIGEMIEDQRKWTADETKRAEEEKARVAKARAAEDAQRKQLLDALVVTVFDKGFEHADYQDYITFKMMYENKSGKDIRGFKGAIVFNDLFGSPIMPVNITEDEPLTAGASKRQSFTLKFNQFSDKHVKLRDTALENMKVEWRPDAILFTDGTSMEVKSE